MRLELHPKQSVAFQSKATEILYGGAAGGGKALACDTPIPTPLGWRVMGDLAPGEYVLGSDGKPTLVIGATPVMLGRPCFRVTFDDGEQIVADADHLWDTFDARALAELTRRTDEYRARRRASRPSRATGNKSAAFVAALSARNAKHRHQTLPAPSAQTRTTAEIAATLRTPRGRANHAIRNAGALDLPAAALPIDPYVLGLWLGDGTGSQAALTMSPDDAAQIMPHIEAAGYVCRKRASECGYGVLGLLQPLRNLGVLNNKHAPTDYLRASSAQRLALLQGLMDTDGTVARHSGAAQFTNTNESLADAVLDLACSMGWKPTKREGRARLNGKDCGQKWTVSFVADQPVFRLPRKAQLQKAPTRRTTAFRYIVACDSVESVPVRCIQVAAGDSLYLAGRRMVPTHNSHLMRVIAIALAISCPGIQIYLFRRTYPDLWKNHMEGPTSFPSLLAEWVVSGFVKLNLSDNQVIFSNGSKVHLCHCQHEKDAIKFQGAEIHVLLVDELTHFTEKIYRFLRGRCRLGAFRPTEQWAEKLPFILNGANPGGIGHHWVRASFIDGAVPLEIRKMPPKEGGMLRQYIPARLDDNPTMDADYADKLSGLGSETMVRAMLDGDWDIVAGAYFTEFSRDRHVVKPFTIPVHWARYRAFDWGSAKPFACYWIAVSDGTLQGFPRGALVVYREYYGMKDGEPNVGLKLPADRVAQEIKRKDLNETTEGTLMSVADPAIFAADGGESIAETMRKQGVRWRHADNKRRAGWEQVRIRLTGDGDGNPLLFIFETCVHLIRTLPALQHDEHDPEDVDTNNEDHGPDALRYGCMARPIVRDAAPTRKGPKPGTFAHLLETTDEREGPSPYRSVRPR